MASTSVRSTRWKATGSSSLKRRVARVPTRVIITLWIAAWSRKWRGIKSGFRRSERLLSQWNRKSKLVVARYELRLGARTASECLSTVRRDVLFDRPSSPDSLTFWVRVCDLAQQFVVAFRTVEALPFKTRSARHATSQHR